jgi:D-alanine transaminase
MMFFYRDGFVSKEQVAVSPDDRGYYFGDGVYEVFRIYGGRLYEKEAHLERLRRSAEGVRIELPYPVDEIAAIAEKLLDLEQTNEGILYLQITRGEAPRSHPFPEGAKPVLMAYCKEAKRPLETMRQGIAAVTKEDIRWLRCDLKTLNLLPNVLAKQEALDRGADEVILHRGGTVTECSASNVMMVKDGVLRTHPANHLILHGITRAVVLRLAAKIDLEVREAPFTLDELVQADEVFITGTTVEITPVLTVDGKPVGSGTPGPWTRRLQDAFEETIRG